LDDDVGDAELVARLAATRVADAPEAVGSDPDEALHELLDRHGGAIAAMARRMLGSREEAEEILQDTFLKLTQHAHEFTPRRASVRTYLYAIARSPRLAADRRALVTALYALPEELDPEPVPAAVWERIRAGARAISAPGHRTGTSASAFPAGDGRPPAAGSDAAGWRPGGTGMSRVGSQASDRHARKPHRAGAAPGRTGGRILARRATVLGAALAVALLAATSSWAIHATGQSHRLAREERIVAYWMRRPDLRILPLQAVAGGGVRDRAGTTEVPAGIVCLLPDGRAMLLQPSLPPSGSRYVLYGETSLGRVELGDTRGRFLLFDHRGLSGVTLAVEGRRAGAIAHVRF